MAYLTREMASKTWAIPRKGTKYVITPSHEKDMGVPLLILIRDVLGLVKTRKELKKILVEKKVLVNNKIAKEDNLSLLLFDTLSLDAAKQYYRVTISEHKKLNLIEIDKKDCGKKICKLINKTVLKGKKIQLNFSGGVNMLTEEKIKIGDSALIDIEKKKIEKILSVKENVKVLVIKGKHLGNQGKIEKIEGEKIIVKVGDEEIMIKKEEIIVLD